MRLQPIILSADAAHMLRTPVARDLKAEMEEAARPCAFCGGAVGRLQVEEGGLSACPLCTLPLHLERRRIDEEATLVWLPEMSQQVVNILLREAHMGMRALGESLHADAVFRGKSERHRALHCVRAVLSERVGAALARAGTLSPRELGRALLDLAPAAYGKRSYLLGGLRLLPLGRFFEDGQDIYPQIVHRWLTLPSGITPTHRTA